MGDWQTEYIKDERVIHAPQLQRGPGGAEGSRMQCGEEQHAPLAEQVLKQERERERDEIGIR